MAGDTRAEPEVEVLHADSRWAFIAKSEKAQVKAGLSLRSFPLPQPPFPSFQFLLKFQEFPWVSGSRAVHGKPLSGPLGWSRTCPQDSPPSAEGLGSRTRALAWSQGGRDLLSAGLTSPEAPSFPRTPAGMALGDRWSQTLPPKTDWRGERASQRGDRFLKTRWGSVTSSLSAEP